MQEGKSGYIEVCNKGNRQPEHQRSGSKLRNSAFCVWEDASLWAHWIHSFHKHLSCLGPILFPWSPCCVISRAPRQSLWRVAASAGLQFWEPSFIFRGQKLLMAVTFLVYWYVRRSFISQFIIHFVLKYFGAQVVPDWVSRNPFRMARNVLVTCPHYVFQHFLALWYPRMSQACLLAPVQGRNFE